MTSSDPDRSPLSAMLFRVHQLLDHWGIDAPADADDVRDSVRASLRLVTDRVRHSEDDSELWLALVATAGAFPGIGDVEKLIAARGMPPGQFYDTFVAQSAAPAAWASGPRGRLRFVEGGLVVDVHSCATSDRHTGIQRVEREALPRWARRAEFELVAWNWSDGAYRELAPDERRRVLQWSGRGSAKEPDTSWDGIHHDIVVPLGVTLVLPEVADRRRSSRLAALARFSGNRVTAIGYDMIPLTSPDLLPRDFGTDFLDYLFMIRHCETIAGISRSATDEFRGLFTALGIEEKTTTRLVTCELPTDVPITRARHEDSQGIPVILCVGSHEPRKNHGAILFAAEKLWREGLEFRLEFIGGGGWGTDFDAQAERLRRRGRQLDIRKAAPDRELWEAYRRARFTVFPSLHEGYGLPVAESLAFGTPVVTTDYGSTAEIAERGGCLTVDPRNDGELLEAMRQLLVDEELHTRLSVQAAGIALRSWDDYADDLWKELVDDVR